MNLQRKLQTALTIFQNLGWNGVKKRLRKNYSAVRQKKAYQKWVYKYDTLTENERGNLRRRIDGFSCQPLISVVMPVYNVEEKWLRRCIESVFRQIYENWEFCIADDCSPSPHIRRVLEEYAAQDGRVKIFFRKENGHISAASNSALEFASGEFCAFLDHDDELSEHALFYAAKEINQFPEAKMIYSDEDMIDERGSRFQPKFKPDWSRDLFYSLNLITHLAVYRTDILRKIGGFRTGFEGSQDYDLALRFTEQISENQIRHIPKILYHWRKIEGSVALSSEEKPYAHERAREAIRSHLERLGKRAVVSRSVDDFHRVQYDLPADLPKVSLIILEKNDAVTAQKTAQTFAEQTDYLNFEIVLAVSEKVKSALENELLPRNLKIIAVDQESEAAAYNCSVAHSDGEILCFANAGLRPAAKNWMSELVSLTSQPEIGAVGGKIVDSSDKVLHGGIVLGANGSTGITYHGLPAEISGSLERLEVIGNFSAAAIDCLATRRELFQSFGGFDAENFPHQLFDIDFCLKLREKMLRIVFTPVAEMIHLPKKCFLNLQKPQDDAELARLNRKWRDAVRNDPFYNPNLSGGKVFPHQT